MTPCTGPHPSASPPPSPRGGGTGRRRLRSRFASGFRRKIKAPNGVILRRSSPGMLLSPRRGERAHGQRPMRRRGAIERDWAGGGYSGVSGDPGVGRTCPPSASLGIGVRVLMIRVPWRPELVGNGEPDPARPQQGRLLNAGGKRWRGAVGFVETVFIQRTSDVVRRSASLSIPSAVFRVRRPSRALGRGQAHAPVPNRGPLNNSSADPAPARRCSSGSSRG